MKSPICDHEVLVKLIMQVNKLIGASLSAYVKRSINYLIELIMELFCAFWAKIRSLEGETNVYGLYWNINFHYGERRRHVRILGSVLMRFASIIDYTKETSNLLSLIASIVFSDSIGVKNYIYWTY